MNEFKLSNTTGMQLLNRNELMKVFSKTLEYTNYLKVNVFVKFIYNLELGSLSVHFYIDEQLDYWFLFQDDKLNNHSLNKLKKENGVTGQ